MALKVVSKTSPDKEVEEKKFTIESFKLKDGGKAKYKIFLQSISNNAPIDTELFDSVADLLISANVIRSSENSPRYTLFDKYKDWLDNKVSDDEINTVIVESFVNLIDKNHEKMHLLKEILRLHICRFKLEELNFAKLLQLCGFIYPCESHISVGIVCYDFKLTHNGISYLQKVQDAINYRNMGNDYSVHIEGNSDFKGATVGGHKNETNNVNEKNWYDNKLIILAIVIVISLLLLIVSYKLHFIDIPFLKSINIPWNLFSE